MSHNIFEKTKSKQTPFLLRMLFDYLIPKNSANIKRDFNLLSLIYKLQLWFIKFATLKSPKNITLLEKRFACDLRQSKISVKDCRGIFGGM